MANLTVNVKSNQDTPQDTLMELAQLLEQRKPENGGDPETSYVARLMAKGPDAFLKKIGEEATEVVMAAKDGDREKIVYEVADLWFHSMIALSFFGLSPQDVVNELQRRAGTSGINEKAMRKLAQRVQDEGASAQP